MFEFVVSQIDILLDFCLNKLTNFNNNNRCSLYILDFIYELHHCGIIVQLVTKIIICRLAVESK